MAHGKIGDGLRRIRTVEDYLGYLARKHVHRLHQVHIFIGKEVKREREKKKSEERVV